MNLESVYWNTVGLIFKTACDVCLSQAVLLNRTACDVCLSQAVFDWPPVMLFYITVSAPQAVLGTACVEANRTACTEVYCSSAWRSFCLISDTERRCGWSPTAATVPPSPVMVARRGGWAIGSGESRDRLWLTRCSSPVTPWLPIVGVFFARFLWPWQSSGSFGEWTRWPRPTY
jgi:hypothetical protein